MKRLVYKCVWHIGMTTSRFAMFIAPGDGKPNKLSWGLFCLGGWMEGKANECMSKA